MADVLSGDMIHHALNLGICLLETDYNGVDNRKQMEVCKQIVQWRWLIIGETSMVSARHLADVDVKLRSLLPSSSMHKTINMVLFGHLEV